MTKMDHPTSPSPINCPAKRQCRVSYALEDKPKLENQPHSVMNKLQYCGSVSERFRLFIMVLFQPWKRAIFKPTLSMRLSLDRDSMW
ncbi:hypothetical protein PROQFM164_S02g002887 [Penicillium roqueforti FM164]|uniref:Uncharacterized protein n=1 Tax=Penicillium roqueforti (strain FM164) TaxID=1365484 RepID=W6Q9Q1_PENRF|nr:hypothetical protein PROQFM164_S02g002887 [Penicillium roqueforti FM164]